MAVKNYYTLLDIAPTATIDDVKRAFRQRIALYHPDKVHHLGKEFQEMAAERAAALTEAYRILSHEERRAEYDKAVAAAGGAAPVPAATPPGGATAHATAEPAAQPHAGPEPGGTARTGQTGGQFHHERASRDAFIRKAAMSRFRAALDAVVDCEHTQVTGFDFACLPKAGRLFSRSKGPKLLGRFVPSVDGKSVAEAWSRAAPWAAGDETCIFLIGSEVAPAGELAAAIAEQRRKTARMNCKVTLIPVDARNWDAHMPVDAPGVAKNVLNRLRTGG